MSKASEWLRTRVPRPETGAGAVHTMLCDDGEIFFKTPANGAKVAPADALHLAYWLIDLLEEKPVCSP